MNTEDFKLKCVLDVREAIVDYESILSVEFDEIFDYDETFISGSVVVTFKYGDLIKKDTINFGWNDCDGYGLLDNECENISEFSREALFILLFFGLAFLGLGDDYLL